MASIIQTRPYDFGTDAIERQRVSLGQSLIDADFEYGLQATKWQTYADTRRFPSFYEIPGTEIPVTQCVYNAGTATVTQNVVVTNVSTYTGIFPAVGSLISVNNLQDIGGNTQDRAQGLFRVETANTNSFSYTTRGNLTTAGRVDTSSTVVRRGGYYGGVSNVAGTTKLNMSTSNIYWSGGPGLITINASTGQNHGLIPGCQLYLSNLTSTALSNAICTVTGTPSTNTFQFSSVVSSGTAVSEYYANVYMHSCPVITHRPFDGGVLISTQNPAFASSVARQSKKVFRYQSGKGLLWSSGTLFCPNNDISTVTAAGTAIGSLITITASIILGTPQPGSTVIIKGITTPGYNGTYVINSVLNNCTITVLATQVLGSTTPVFTDQPRFIISQWHGSSLRAGIFDDQNGLFWDFDGQTLWAVKRSSTFQISGTVTIVRGQNNLVGSGTRFSQQLRINDKIVLRGMTYVVTTISSDTAATVTPPYRGSADLTTPGATVCKIKEQRTPQNLFNRDTIDGRGSSGYKVDLTKMQMIGIQYTWYGAGFVDFMIRGQDGNWVYAHRYRQNNMNDEAYMRTGNLPVRYEIINESSHAQTTNAVDIQPSDTTIVTTDDLTYWPTGNAVLMCNNEFIRYGSRTSNTFTNLTRNATITYNILDVSTNLTANTTAQPTVKTGNTLFLCSTTCSPSLTHWGSAFLMDGQFDNDRGYLFNYNIAASAVNYTAGNTYNMFLLRLSPSVSNGQVGDLGTRDLLNRAQLLLQRLDVWVTGATPATCGANVVGILNPVFTTQFSSAAQGSWQNINSPATGGQPSFAQVVPTASISNFGTYVAGSGERIFSTICNAGTQNSLDLTGLKEVCNNIIGGSNFFPDGPDTLLVQIAVPTGFSAITQYSLNLFWSEQQA